jgi:hypothetical protein
MDAAGSSETLLPFCKTAWRHISGRQLKINGWPCSYYKIKCQIVKVKCKIRNSSDCKKNWQQTEEGHVACVCIVNVSGNAKSVSTFQVHTYIIGQNDDSSVTVETSTAMYSESYCEPGLSVWYSTRQVGLKCRALCPSGRAEVSGITRQVGLKCRTLYLPGRAEVSGTLPVRSGWSVGYSTRQVGLKCRVLYLSGRAEVSGTLSVRSDWSVGHYPSGRALPVRSGWSVGHSTCQVGLKCQALYPSRWVKCQALPVRWGRSVGHSTRQVGPIHSSWSGSQVWEPSRCMSQLETVLRDMTLHSLIVNCQRFEGIRSLCNTCIYHTTRPRIAEDCNVHIYHGQNVRYHQELQQANNWRLRRKEACSNSAALHGAAGCLILMYLKQKCGCATGSVRRGPRPDIPFVALHTSRPVVARILP